MIIIWVAVYLFLIFAIIHVSPRLLWLVFFMFCYRFWEGLIPVEKMTKYITLKHDWDYYIIILIIALATYFLLIFATGTDSVLRYIFMAVMVAYTLKVHDLSDIFMFKDYLEAWGVWDIEFWKNQFKELFAMDAEGHISKMREAGSHFVEQLLRLVGYVKEI